MKIVAVEPIGMNSSQIAGCNEKFTKLGHQFTCFTDRKEDSDTLKQRMHLADVVIISNIKLDCDILSACPNLKLLAVAFTGIDHIDMEFCTAHGIEVVNAPGYAVTAVAELVIGLAIDLQRKITELDAVTRRGGTRQIFLGKQLKDKRVGIIGTGNIGRKTAEYFQALGCEVVAYNRTLYEEVIKSGVQYLPLDELLSTSDIISLHLPYTTETDNLISSEKLALCKPTTVIINAARGKLIDYFALSQALRKGQIAGAALDVFETEPPLPESHPLFTAPNCILTPHIGYATQEAFALRIEIVIEKITKWICNKNL